MVVNKWARSGQHMGNKCVMCGHWVATTKKWALGMQWVDNGLAISGLAMSGQHVGPMWAAGNNTQGVWKEWAMGGQWVGNDWARSEEHTSELQSH